MPFLLWLEPGSRHYHGGLALHGVLPTLAGKSGPAGVICTVMVCTACLPLLYRLPRQELLSCVLMAFPAAGTCICTVYTIKRHDRNHPRQAGAGSPHVNSSLVRTWSPPQRIIRSLFGPLLPNPSGISNAVRAAKQQEDRL
jgi:hypothetical protein